MSPATRALLLTLREAATTSGFDHHDVGRHVLPALRDWQDAGFPDVAQDGSPAAIAWGRLDAAAQLRHVESLAEQRDRAEASLAEATTQLGEARQVAAQLRTELAAQHRGLSSLTHLAERLGRSAA